MNNSHIADPNNSINLFPMIDAFFDIHLVIKYGIKARKRFQGRNKYAKESVTTILINSKRQLKLEDTNNHS